jgi:phage/plasmid-associated DNA primase
MELVVDVRAAAVMAFDSDVDDFGSVDDANNDDCNHAAAHLEGEYALLVQAIDADVQAEEDGKGQDGWYDHGNSLKPIHEVGAPALPRECLMAQ